MGCNDLEGFSDVARDHAMYPRNNGQLTDCDGHARILGPCGDTMEFWVVVRNGIVHKASFITDGCGSSLACGSMATVLVEGGRIGDAAVLRQGDILTALGGLPPEFEHCALLAANTLKAACEDCLERKKETPGERHGERTACYTCGEGKCFSSGREMGENDEDLKDRSILKYNKEVVRMKIAIPLADGKLAMHFGHCECFALVEVNPAEKKILKREDIEAPPHEPGLLPPWLSQHGAKLIIAGGMGSRARELFAQHGIQVIIGAPADTPESLVGDYLSGTLRTGDNVCDH